METSIFLTCWTISEFYGKFKNLTFRTNKKNILDHANIITECLTSGPFQNLAFWTV